MDTDYEGNVPRRFYNERYCILSPFSRYHPGVAGDVGPGCTAVTGCNFVIRLGFNTIFHTLVNNPSTSTNNAVHATVTTDVGYNELLKRTEQLITIIIANSITEEYPIMSLKANQRLSCFFICSKVSFC